MDMKRKYEGVQIHSVYRTSAEYDINHMYYNGEHPPTMTWDIFSTRLKGAYKKIDDIEQHPPGQPNANLAGAEAAAGPSGIRRQDEEVETEVTKRPASLTAEVPATKVQKQEIH